MNNILESELATYLGELMHQHETCFDWIEKEKISAKINACHVLLGIDKKLDSWYEKIAPKINITSGRSHKTK